MNRSDVTEYYSNEFIIKELIKNAKSREVAGAFMDGRYDQRPNIIQFPSDVIQMARKGITSFHFSVEHWSNPMAIATDNYERLRTGWDMIIDIDSKLGLDESKLAVVHICNLLRKYGIKNFGLKFSGRRGFHISVSWKCFPKEIDYKPLEKQYPDVPRIVANFIRHKIRDDLLKDIIKSKSTNVLREVLGDTFREIDDPFYFIEVEKDWGNRHMFRAPYSFNEKTWLVSVPINFSSLNSFTPKEAEWENVLKKAHPEFFVGEEGEATDLLMDAIDWNAANKKEEVKHEKKLVTFDKKISEENFPPCIKTALSGMNDGKKRTLFTLINFLKMMNWNSEEIEIKIKEWNTKNQPPLPQTTILAQLRYSEKKEIVPPSNCDNSMYFLDIGLCRPDNVCKSNSDKITLKNPVGYPFRIMKRTKKSVKTKKQRGFSCGVCNKEFDTETKLAMHKGRMH